MSHSQLRNSLTRLHGCRNLHPVPSGFKRNSDHLWSSFRPSNTTLNLIWLLNLFRVTRRKEQRAWWRAIRNKFEVDTLESNGREIELSFAVMLVSMPGEGGRLPEVCIFEGCQNRSGTTSLAVAAPSTTSTHPGCFRVATTFRVASPGAWHCETRYLASSSFMFTVVCGGLCSASSAAARCG